MKKYPGILLLLSLLSVQTFAQSGSAGVADPFFYERNFPLMLLVLAGVVIVAAIAALFQLLNIMVKVQQIRIFQEQGLDAFMEEVKKPKESWWSNFYASMTKTVPVEQEEDILFDHEYDGIRELDNSLPPWWVAMFYITIAFAVVYMFYFHFSGYGLSSSEQYAVEMEKAEEEVEAYLAKQANLVDEKSVVMLEDDGALSQGESIFQTNCAACHGALGEGGVGPNLTDPYWLHGGSIQDVFKTIKYGVPEKGMISWKEQIRPAEMQKVASFIMTLEGTNPPNPKEPQGDLYQSGGSDDATAPATDSLGVDTTQIMMGMNY